MGFLDWLGIKTKKDNPVGKKNGNGDKKKRT